MFCYLPVGFVDFFAYRYGFAFYIKVIFLLSHCVILLFFFSVLLFENKKGGLLHFGVKSPPKITIKLTLIVIELFNFCVKSYFQKLLLSKKHRHLPLNTHLFSQISKWMYLLKTPFICSLSY